MRKLALLFAVFLVVTGLLTGVKNYFGSFQKITISVKNPANTYSLELYKAIDKEDEITKNGEKLQTITSNTTLKLKKGIYVLVPKGDNLDTKWINFTLANTPKTITLDIPYSEDYLIKQVTSELAELNNVITSANPFISILYDIQRGQLYGKAEWYGTTLTPKNDFSENRNGDVLRVLLHRENNKWVLLSDPPKIILSAPNFPNVPLDVLEAINKL